MDRTDRPSDSHPKDEDISARLAHIIANNDMDELKQLLLEKLGIGSREELIDKALALLDGYGDEDDVQDVQEKPVARSGKRSLNTSVRRLIDESPPSTEDVHAEDDIDLNEPLDENQGLLLKLLYERLVDRFVRDDPRVNLLYALKPFLNERRQQKIDAAVRMMGIQSAIQAQLVQTKGV